MRKTPLLLACTLLAAMLAFTGAGRDQALHAAEAKSGAAVQAAAETQKRLALFKDVYERIRAEYVERPDEDKLIESAIGGMLAALDPHSEYMNQKTYDDVQAQTHGEFGGVGIRVAIENGRVKVLAPIAETPAARAGIKADDIIVQIDGQPLDGMSLNQVADRMRGPVGTTVKLRIARDGQAKPLQLAIVRETIRVPSVQFRREGDDVGYIRITRFNYQTTEGLRHAIRELSGRGDGDGVKGYVLDLRNNPGGLIDQAVGVASTFLDNGEIVSLRGRDGSIEHFDARFGRGDLTGGKQVVVLINGGSASSSEIVAGALQDHKRATILGTRSYGKGSVQTIIPLGRGNGALRLTSARYFTPSGRSIQAQGIVPDIEIAQIVPELQTASLETHSEAKLPGHLKAEGEEHSGSQSFVPANAADDHALQKALDLLRGAHLDATAPAAPVIAPVSAN